MSVRFFFPTNPGFDKWFWDRQFKDHSLEMDKESFFLLCSISIEWKMGWILKHSPTAADK